MAHTSLRPQYRGAGIPVQVFICALATFTGCALPIPEGPVARHETPAAQQAAEPAAGSAVTSSAGNQVAPVDRIDSTTAAVRNVGYDARQDPQVQERVDEILASQQELDETLWKPEVLAQRHEQYFVDLWDGIRNAADKWSVLADATFHELRLGEPLPASHLDWEIEETTWSNELAKSFTPEEFRATIQAIREQQIEVIDTEWHHSRFEPASDQPAESTVAFTIHARSPQEHFRVTGNLVVTWLAAGEQAAVPVVDQCSVVDLRMLSRPRKGLFRNTLTIDHSTLHPILCYDLNGDHLPEIILPMSNSVLRNVGRGEFQRDSLFPSAQGLMACAQIGDYDSDGTPDLFTVTADGAPVLFRGTGDGQFDPHAHHCAPVKIDFCHGITSGDIDADGDLDIWLTQRTRISRTDVLPQPYFDANNGLPSYLLLNDGQGNFQDATEESGLAPKRNRWTFLASFIDLDGDGDLDLVNMADFAGLDLYRNDGTGRFTDATQEWIDERHFFGMGLAFTDFNGDGRLDFFGTGMSSTTARRLDRLGLMNEDRPEWGEMRKAMGYGNRLYYGNGGRFEEDSVTAATVARTGWAWGATALDFDLDGDQDLYVVNGYRSGKSCRDYCTRYWTHDLYVEESGPVLRSLIEEMHIEQKALEISWNGYEHNALLMNQPSGAFANVALLFDAAFVYDARVAISEDFDGDGRPDLLVSQETAGESRRHRLLHVYLNQHETPHAWVGVQIPESGPGYSPFGAVVTVETDLNTQRQWLVAGDALYGQESNILHFGLGAATEIKYLEVRWPNGDKTRVEQPAMRQYHMVRPAATQPPVSRLVHLPNDPGPLSQDPRRTVPSVPAVPGGSNGADR